MRFTDKYYRSVPKAFEENIKWRRFMSDRGRFSEKQAEHIWIACSRARPERAPMKNSREVKKMPRMLDRFRRASLARPPSLAAGPDGSESLSI